jgi:hypothetical protein
MHSRSTRPYRAMASTRTSSSASPIGLFGSEGNSAGSHLHFEVHLRNGSIYGAHNVNPATWLAVDTPPGTVRRADGAGAVWSRSPAAEAVIPATWRRLDLVAAGLVRCRQAKPGPGESLLDGNL